MAAEIHLPKDDDHGLLGISSIKFKSTGAFGVLLWLKKCIFTPISKNWGVCVCVFLALPRTQICVFCSTVLVKGFPGYFCKINRGSFEAIECGISFCNPVLQLPELNMAPPR